uniref:MYND-type domain-containing protein n=1 Tax=Panagrellus redivivus TaxID=6233 RepID=A0A7E5A057_PANRE
MEEIIRRGTEGELSEALNAITSDERFKKPLLDLERHWLTEYSMSREKLLCALTEKLHAEFVSDQAKIRSELLAQFKDELESTKADLQKKYEESLKVEVAKTLEKNKREISAAKKKQWCWNCESEAIYHCCWNTAYCSTQCQQQHWSSHRRFCRRRKQGGGAPGNNPANLTNGDDSNGGE